MLLLKNVPCWEGHFDFETQRKGLRKYLSGLLARPSRLKLHQTKPVHDGVFLKHLIHNAPTLSIDVPPELRKQTFS